MVHFARKQGISSAWSVGDPEHTRRGNSDGDGCLHNRRKFVTNRYLILLWKIVKENMGANLFKFIVLIAHNHAFKTFV